MKRRLILIAFAMFLTGSLVSCGDKNDKALDKLESIVKEAKKHHQKLIELGGEFEKIQESINEEELSPEQQERLWKIAASAYETVESDREYN